MSSERGSFAVAREIATARSLTDGEIASSEGVAEAQHRTVVRCGYAVGMNMVADWLDEMMIVVGDS